MPYVPNNVLVFVAAYAGAVSGMVVAGKVLTSPVVSKYSAVAAVAGAFAQSFDTEWGIRATTDLDLSIIEEECEGAFTNRYPNTSKPNTLLPATYTNECRALIALVTAAEGYFAIQGIVPPSPSPVVSQYGVPIDLSVNAASVDFGWKDILDNPTAVMRTGSRINLAGAFNGGGTGNKSILGAKNVLNGKPISFLLSTSFMWQNLLGPRGQFYNPADPVSTVDLYMNLLIDFDPLGVHDLRYLIICNSSGTLAIANATGVYLNPGGLNTLDYSWNSSLDALIVNAPPNPVPGGVPVNIDVGPSWLDKTYQWSALVAANPDAVFVDAFPATFGAPNGDGGAPVGAIVAATSITSGDSGALIKSGKHILEWRINGTNVLNM